MGDQLNRAELRHFAKDWKAYAARFGYLDLRKKEWERMNTAALGRFLRFHKVQIEPSKDGNPQITLRLHGPLLRWIERNGGSDFVREKLEQMAFPELGSGAYGWERIRTVQGVRRSGGLVEQKHFVLWRRGKTWLYLPPETEPQRTATGYRTSYEAREQVAQQVGYDVQDAPAPVFTVAKESGVTV